MVSKFLDPRTGYPPGFVEGWWRCPSCGDLFHDSEQRGKSDISWGHDPYCTCGSLMERECDGPRSDPPQSELDQARQEVERLREALDIVGVKIVEEHEATGGPAVQIGGMFNTDPDVVALMRELLAATEEDDDDN